MAILSFGSKVTQDLFEGNATRETAKIATALQAQIRRKLFVLHYAHNLNDLRSPPGNRLERLSGNLADFWSIRVNDQWRLMFRWDANGASAVQVVDYH